MSYIRRFMRGSIFSQFMGHVTSAFVLSSPCYRYYLWTPYGALCREKSFFILLLVFECLPRLFGFVFGKLKNNFFQTRATNLPTGNWVMIGNYLPEYSIELFAPYPTNSNELIINGYAFTQSCTIGGFLAVAMHTWTYLFQKINIKTGFLSAGSYFLPVIENPHPGYQTDVLLLPSSDERIWFRSFQSRPNYVLYYWVHESHPFLDVCLCVCNGRGRGIT